MHQTVGDLINTAIPLQGPSSERSVTVRGRLICTSQFAYIADGIEDPRGILIAIGTNDDPTPIYDRLIQCVPILVGSYISFDASAEISGTLSPCILPMFPRLLHSVKEVRYDGSLLQKTEGGYKLDPPLMDDAAAFEFLDPSAPQLDR